QIKELNHKYRGIDRTTDVLSFPQIQNKMQDTRFRIQNKKNRESCIVHRESFAGLVLGDVVINLQAVKRQAPEHGLSFNEELQWLLVHGILHLIGYDHERSKYAERKMRTKERELLDYLRKDKN
ncbi:MAG: rRNA maturation RNase YbeY, partial [Nitrospirota bacterium]|nr:rRNA maturation RNase YbeY [Nitrospirota bacterium]